MGTHQYRVLTDGLDEVVWQQQRQTGVTATDVARLHSGGASTWAAIRAEKAGTKVDFTFPAMQHGKDREPVIARFAQRRFGLAPSRAVLAAEDEPRFLATPDGLADDLVGEYKTTVKDWATVDQLPKRYYDQVTWQMRVAGHREARLVFEAHEAGIPLHMEPRDFLIRYDEGYASELEDVAREFLAYDGAIDPRAAVLDGLIGMRMEARDIQAAAEARVEAIDAQIREYLEGAPTRFEGSYAMLTLGAGSSRTTLDSARLKDAEPDTYARFSKTTTVRGRLTITARKDER